MKEKIKQELKKVEKDYNIKILYAVESGSRAWGFPSKDSDWDVRFIYVHTKEWYLSIDDKKDSMEFMLPGDLDFAGWELRKTLKLFRKSNPPLLEWLRSPLIYLEQYSAVEKMRQLSDYYFNPKSCTYHYLHMAIGNYRDYLQQDVVRVKKYFYVLRPLLACKWIESNGTMPPMEFNQLVESEVDDITLKNDIKQLIERKKSGEELDKEPRIESIHQFIENHITYFSDKVKTYNKVIEPETEKLDALFRNALTDVWNRKE